MSTNINTDHNIFTYIRAKRRVDELMDDLTENATAMPMPSISSPLTKASNAMSCIPFIQFPLDLDDEALTIKGVEAGTLDNPKIDVILEKSPPSPFGRGSETCRTAADGRSMKKR